MHIIYVIWSYGCFENINTLPFHRHLGGKTFFYGVLESRAFFKWFRLIHITLRLLLLMSVWQNSHFQCYLVSESPGVLVDTDIRAHYHTSQGSTSET